MTYTVEGKGPAPVTFAPSSRAEEILQNVRTLLRTVKFSVPLDRALGVDFSFIDSPAPEGFAKLRAEIADAIAEGEPRAKVRVVEFRRYEDEALAGTFYPVLRIEVSA
jgi:phage baseplate assembly protein W